MTKVQYTHLSRPDEHLHAILERTLRAIAEYPDGAPTKERRYEILYGLNDLVARVKALPALADRPHLDLERAGTIVASPRVDFTIDGREGAAAEELGVLYQFDTRGRSVRFGISCYSEDEDEDVAPDRTAHWIARASPLLAALAAQGFRLASGSTESAEMLDRWGAGWLAWREYARGAVPGDDQLQADVDSALLVYDDLVEELAGE